MTILRTERLALREFTAADADLLVELDSDPAVMHFITGGAPTPRHEIETDYLPAFLRYHERGDGYGFFAVERRADGAFLGWVHFRPRPDDAPHHVELGYRLRRAAWGHGYATEASRAIVDRGFRHLGTQRVCAETMVVNTASRRVMHRCGLHYVRVFRADWPVRIPGDEHGDIEYALTREQWLADPSYQTSPGSEPANG